jgi:hypothetical protein
MVYLEIQNKFYSYSATRNAYLFFSIIGFLLSILFYVFYLINIVNLTNLNKIPWKYLVKLFYYEEFFAFFQAEKIKLIFN